MIRQLTSEEEYVQRAAADARSRTDDEADKAAAVNQGLTRVFSLVPSADEYHFIIGRRSSAIFCENE